MPSAQAEIAGLIAAWARFRDQQSWDALLDTFHEGGTISLSWFEGPYPGFVAASRRLAENSDALVKHRLGVPLVRVNGSRALSEVDVTIMLRAKTPVGEVDTTSYARFFDRLEERGGRWKLWQRTAIYEKDQAAAVGRPSLPEEFFEGLDRHPAEVRFLASSLERVGAKLSPGLVLDRSPELPVLYREADAWLSGGGRE